METGVDCNGTLVGGRGCTAQTSRNEGGSHKQWWDAAHARSQWRRKPIVKASKPPWHAVGKLLRAIQVARTRFTAGAPSRLQLRQGRGQHAAAALRRWRRPQGCPPECYWDCWPGGCCWWGHEARWRLQEGQCASSSARGAAATDRAGRAIQQGRHSAWQTARLLHVGWAKASTAPASYTTPEMGPSLGVLVKLPLRSCRQRRQGAPVSRAAAVGGITQVL